MSVVAAIKKDTTESVQIVLGADSAIGNRYYQQRLERPKLVTKSNMVLGVTGDYAVAQWLDHWEPPLPATGQPAYEYIVEAVNDSIWELLKRKGYPPDKEDSSDILLVYEGSIYKLNTANRYAYEVAAPYTAIGTGLELCLGALNILSGWGPDRLDIKMRLAIRAACLHQPYCDLPAVTVTYTYNSNTGEVIIDKAVESGPNLIAFEDSKY